MTTPLLSITDPEAHGGAPPGSLAARLLAHGFTLRLDLLEEDRGPDYDNPADNAAILKAYNAGDPWAWFTARLTITHPDAPGIAGTDYLGGCGGYNPAQWFHPSGHWPDMVANAFQSYGEAAQAGARALRIASQVMA